MIILITNIEIDIFYSVKSEKVNKILPLFYYKNRVKCFCPLNIQNFIFSPYTNFLRTFVKI
jgi:hypothetical protein